MKKQNQKTQDGKMPLWSIGPSFLIISFILGAIALFFSFQYKDVFFYHQASGLSLILGILIIIVGLFFWMLIGTKIHQYLQKGILATQGGYGLVRNPIYTGILCVILGVSFCFKSWLLMSSVILDYIVLRFLLFKEEELLYLKFGEKFIEYKQKVNPIIPKLKSFHQAFFYPENTKQICENFYVVRSRDVNIFLFTKHGNLLCFDTGYGNKSMLKEFEKIGINPDDVTKIFLTHSDHDHTKGIKFFKNASLYLSEKEEALINGKKKRIRFIYSNPKIARDYHLIRPNDEMNIDGINIKIIEASGHTLGHVNYIIDDKYLICGDAIVIQNDEIIPFYSPFSMLHKKTKQTAEIIKLCRGKYYICSSHTGICAK